MDKSNKKVNEKHSEPITLPQSLYVNLNTAGAREALSMLTAGSSNPFRPQSGSDDEDDSDIGATAINMDIKLDPEHRKILDVMKAVMTELSVGFVLESSSSKPYRRQRLQTSGKDVPETESRSSKYDEAVICVCPNCHRPIKLKWMGSHLAACESKQSPEMWHCHKIEYTSTIKSSQTASDVKKGNTDSKYTIPPRESLGRPKRSNLSIYEKKIALASKHLGEHVPLRPPKRVNPTNLPLVIEEVADQVKQNSPPRMAAAPSTSKYTSKKSKKPAKATRSVPSGNTFKNPAKQKPYVMVVPVPSTSNDASTKNKKPAKATSSVPSGDIFKNPAKQNSPLKVVPAPSTSNGTSKKNKKPAKATSSAPSGDTFKNPVRQNSPVKVVPAPSTSNGTSKKNKKPAKATSSVPSGDAFENPDKQNSPVKVVNAPSTSNTTSNKTKKRKKPISIVCGKTDWKQFFHKSYLRMDDALTTSIMNALKRVKPAEATSSVPIGDVSPEKRFDRYSSKMGQSSLLPMKSMLSKTTAGATASGSAKTTIMGPLSKKRYDEPQMPDKSTTSRRLPRSGCSELCCCSALLSYLDKPTSTKGTSQLPDVKASFKETSSASGETSMSDTLAMEDLDRSFAKVSMAVVAADQTGTATPMLLAKSQQLQQKIAEERRREMKAEMDRIFARLNTAERPHETE